MRGMQTNERRAVGVAVAVLAGALMRVVAHVPGHLVPRDAFVYLVLAAVGVIALCELRAGWRARQGLLAALVVPVAWCAYLLTLNGWSEFPPAPHWCGTGEARMETALTKLSLLAFGVSTLFAVLAGRYARSQGQAKRALCWIAVMLLTLPWMTHAVARVYTVQSPEVVQMCSRYLRQYAGAIEMHELDANQKVETVVDLTEILMKKGYILSPPRDAWPTPYGDKAPFELDAATHSLVCKVHGTRFPF